MCWWLGCCFDCFSWLMGVDDLNCKDLGLCWNSLFQAITDGFFGSRCFCTSVTSNLVGG